MAKEATLSDVVEALRANSSGEKDTTTAISKMTDQISKFISDFDDRWDREKLQNEEDRREQKLQYRGEQINGQFEMPDFKGMTEGFFANVFHGTFLGTVFSNISKYLVTPLLGIGKFVTKKSPLVIGLFAAYYLLKDINENPAFTKAIDKFGDVWNNDIIPMFKSFGKAMENIFQSKEMDEALNVFGMVWDSFSKWFINDFTPIFQDLVINVIGTFADTVGNVADGLKQIFDGDIVDGIINTGKSLFVGLLNILDAGITASLKSFGVDFGPDGSVLKSIIGVFTSIGETITYTFEDIYNYITQTIPQFIVDLKNSLVEWAKGLYNSAVSSIVSEFTEAQDILGMWTGNIIDSVQKFQDGFVNFFEEGFNKIKALGDKIVEKFTSMVDWIVSIPDQVMEYVKSVLPSWLGGNDTAPEKTQLPDKFTIRPDMDASPYVIPRDNTSAEDLKSAIEKYLSSKEESKSSGGLFVQQDNRSTNNSSYSSTNIVQTVPSVPDRNPE